MTPPSTPRRRAPVLLAVAAVALAGLAALALATSGTDPFGGRDGGVGALAAQPSSTPARDRAAAPPPRPPRRPTVVLVTFDRLPWVSLLGRDGRVDPVLYPTFSALAAQSTVFRNYTGAGDDTAHVVPSLLSSVAYKHAGSAPVFGVYPRNIFTLFAARGYRVVAGEEVSWLCPPRLCPQTPARPPAHSPGRVFGEMQGGRVARFRAWVDAIRAGGRPGLYYKHVLLPHQPRVFLPGGQVYQNGFDQPIRGLDGPASYRDRWLSIQLYQRHLLQLQWTDRVLGELIARLKREQLYDAATIVVTADHGGEFLKPGGSNELTEPSTFTGLAASPLIVKRPYQRKGRERWVHVRTVDVLPTLVDAAGTRIPWPHAGRSALAAHPRIPTRVYVERRAGGPPLSIGLRGYERRVRASLDAKLRLFGSNGDGPGLWGVGPHPGLLDRAVSDLDVVPSRTVRGSLVAAGRFRDVHPRSAFVPALIVGWLRGRGVGTGQPMAIAVNGTIRSVSWTARLRRDRRVLFSGLVPAESFRPGANRVEVFRVVAVKGGLVRLERVARAG
jgi:hypothetical protein